MKLSELITGMKASDAHEGKKNFFRDNIEALAGAIAFALIIKQFFFEAFQVPTTSMEPTVIGRSTGGERLIVNKFVYMMRDPNRFEVVVFHYPLNKLMNYVKRCVGMPGEWVFLRNGDIYAADGKLAQSDAQNAAKIQRKPEGVQDAIFKANPCIPPSESDIGHFDDYWKPIEGSKGQFVVKKGDGEVVFRADDGKTMARFERPESQQWRAIAIGVPAERWAEMDAALKDLDKADKKFQDVDIMVERAGKQERERGRNYFQRSPALSNRRYDAWSHVAPEPTFLRAIAGLPSSLETEGPAPGREESVGDIRFSFDVKPDKKSGAAVIELFDGCSPTPFVVTLAVEGAKSESSMTYGGDVIKKFDARLEAESFNSVVITNVDDRLTIEVEGDEVLAFEYTHTPLSPLPQPILGSQETLKAEDAKSLVWTIQPTQMAKNRASLAFGFDGGTARFKDIALSRDIFYSFNPAGATDFQIPSDSYLCLGDNSTDSLDGRAWRQSVMTYRDGANEIVMSGDGEAVSDEQRPGANPYDGGRHFMDDFGNIRDIEKSNIVGEVKTRFAHFVPRDHVVGRAYFTFWPILRWGAIR